MSPEPTDADLVTRCLSAREGFTTLYARHSPAVYGYLWGLLRGDEHAAADVLQETFLRFYRALDRYDTSRPLRPWLFRIATNAALDERARKRPNPQDLDGLDPTLAAEDPAREACVKDAFATILERASETLAPRKVAAFLLARGQGLTYLEIADVHDCSTVTVKRDLMDASKAFTNAALELGLVGR